jgi:penicillin-binding protein 1A
MEKEEKKKKKKTGLSRKFFIRFWGFFAVFLLCIVLFFVCIELEVFGEMPSFEELENPKSMLASEVYSADGKLLGKYYFENRSNVHYSELSPYLISALVATEDARFYDHSGVDIRALGRALKGMTTGSKKGGASTVTQQLVKNLFPRGQLSKAQLIIRKVQEWVTAVKVERSYTKEEIIAMYFNTMDFGSQSFGIKSAARTFFQKEPKDLNMEESALLVGVLNAPTRYSPVQNPERALQRRNVVLSQMKKYGYITEHVCDSVQQLPIVVSS